MIVVENLLVELKCFRLEIDELRVEKGEYVTVLGASGVGKTVLLLTLAGFLRPKKGRIIIDGVDVTNLPPEKRGIALVPQNLGLFPHMSVYDNIAYGLKLRGYPRDEIRKLVEKWADMLGIKHLLHRKPGELSAGEQQRVALARALVINPKLVLLDEPFAHLDPVNRAIARRVVKELHRRTGFTALHVTHDILDVIALADKVVYMHGGRIEAVMPKRQFLESRYARPYLEEVKQLLQELRNHVFMAQG